MSVLLRHICDHVIGVSSIVEWEFRLIGHTFYFFSFSFMRMINLMKVMSTGDYPHNWA